MTPTTLNYAGFWRRFMATMIDGIILGLIGCLFALIHAGTMGVSLLLGVLYTPFFECSELQGTPGKAIMNIRVTDVHGARIGFKMALLRYVGRILSSLLAGLGFLLMLFTEKKQTLHDLIAQTLVIRAEAPKVNHFQAWYQQVLEVLGMAEKSSKKSEPAPSVGTQNSTHDHAVTPADLAELYDLYKKGILTEAEYQQKREDVLKKL